MQAKLKSEAPCDPAIIAAGGFREHRKRHRPLFRVPVIQEVATGHRQLDAVSWPIRQPDIGGEITRYAIETGDMPKHGLEA